MDQSDDLNNQLKLANIKNLLPCPFCGGKGNIYEYKNGEHAVYCVTKGCRLNNLEGVHYQAGTVEKWNKRATITYMFDDNGRVKSEMRVLNHPVCTCSYHHAGDVAGRYRDNNPDCKVHN